VSVVADDGLPALLAQVERHRGLALRCYKDMCLRRRLAVQMRARGVHTFAEYAALLGRAPEEYDLLVTALAINVTKFLRNPETFAVVRARVLEPLWRRGGPIRVWSAGCASGEEPYTLALLFHEIAGAHRAAVRSRVRIDATDVDPGALDDLRRATYSRPAVEDLPPELLAAHFAPGPPFRLDPQVASCVRPLLHDLTRDAAPEPPYDLIVCRNVIIYFDRVMQEQLFAQFTDALAPGAHLLLGKVETLFGEVRGRLVLEDARERLYRRPA
jgi:chemotaxis methyl-accepting protein methylase